MCAMTYVCVWHGPFQWVTWTFTFYSRLSLQHAEICVCAMIHLRVRRDSLMCAVTCLCVTWTISMDDSSIHVWPYCRLSIHSCMCVWLNLFFKRLTWLVRDVTHSSILFQTLYTARRNLHVCHDSFMWHMNHSYQWHDACIHVWRVSGALYRLQLFACVPCMSHSHHSKFACVPRLIYVRCHDLFIFVTWCIHVWGTCMCAMTD